MKTIKTNTAAFANGTAPAAGATTAPVKKAGATTAPVKKAGAPKVEDRIAPSFTEITSDVKPPVASARGQKSELAGKLELLEVGQSIGLTNKTKKQISSTVSKVNNAATNLRQKIGADGALLVKNGDPIRTSDGAIASYKQVPDMERVKHFEAFDVNSKTDPHGATVRIFRQK